MLEKITAISPTNYESLASPLDDESKKDILNYARYKIDQVIEAHKKSDDALEQKVLTSERYTPEFVEMLCTGLTELAEIYKRASPDCRKFIFENPQLILSFSGMLPELNVNSIIKANPKAAKELESLSNNGNTTLHVFKKEKPKSIFMFETNAFFNKKALYLLKSQYPDLFDTPDYVTEANIDSFLLSHVDEYLIFFTKENNSYDEYLREVRNGLISGYELGTCKIYAAVSVFGSYKGDELYYDTNSLPHENPEIKKSLDLAISLKKEDPNIEFKDYEIWSKRVGVLFAKYTEASRIFVYDWYQIIKIFRQIVTEKI